MANAMPQGGQNDAQQSPLDSATNSLTREVGLLHEVLDALESRLSTVLKAENVAGKGIPERTAPNLVPVAHRISERVNSSAATVERARERISQILNLLEV